MSGYDSLFATLAFGRSDDWAPSITATDEGRAAVALVDALTSLGEVQTVADFGCWSQHDLRRCIPFGAFVAVAGKLGPQGIQPLVTSSANMPSGGLIGSGPGQGCYQTLWLRRWLLCGQPQMFDLARDAESTNFGCLKYFEASGLRNLLAHGMFEMSRDHMSFFSFHQLPAAPSEFHGLLLKLLVPVMHAALFRCFGSVAGGKKTAGTPPTALTVREHEVLEWICRGKTNGEIASILKISPNTVKNQTQSILIKKRVNSRAQAAADALRLGIVSNW